MDETVTAFIQLALLGLLVFTQEVPLYCRLLLDAVWFFRDTGPDESKIKSYLPADKQFLYTKNGMSGSKL